MRAVFVAFFAAAASSYVLSAEGDISAAARRARAGLGERRHVRCSPCLEGLALLVLVCGVLRLLAALVGLRLQRREAASDCGQLPDARGGAVRVFARADLGERVQLVAKSSQRSGGAVVLRQEALEPVDERGLGGLQPTDQHPARLDAPLRPLIDQRPLLDQLRGSGACRGARRDPRPPKLHLPDEGGQDREAIRVRRLEGLEGRRDCAEVHGAVVFWRPRHPRSLQQDLARQRAESAPRVERPLRLQRGAVEAMREIYRSPAGPLQLEVRGLGHQVDHETLSADDGARQAEVAPHDLAATGVQRGR